MLSQNKKAHFDYEILDTYEAGIELLGFEVKSIKAKNVHLEGGRVLIRGGEAYLVGIAIPPYQKNNTPKDYDAERTRKLLLKKRELSELAGSTSQKGLTIVPIKLYNKGPKVKLLFGVARGKKKHDKRESIRKRETKRTINRALKNR